MILSIYFGFHDSNVCFADKKKILLHLESERVYRKKHVRLNSSTEMDDLIRRGLDYLGAKISDIDILLLAHWNNKYELDNNGKITIINKKFKPKFTSHHLNHIGTSYPARFKDSLIICADGGSEDGTAKIYLKNNGKITLLEDLDDSIMNGRFFGTLTQLIINPKCSAAHNIDAGKTMGLAAYGKGSERIKDEVLKNKKMFNHLYFNGADRLRKKLKISNNYSKPWVDRKRIEVAYEGQKIWVNEFYNKIESYHKFSKNIALVGGCALNIELNSRIVESHIFKNVFIPPVPSDSGQSLGAILYYYPEIKCDYPFLGRGYGDISPLAINRIAQNLANDITNHEIVAWYQGKGEAGPRALGHRSFLGLPDSNNMRYKLSELIKGREPYRPVSPLIPIEFLEKYFFFKTPARWMNFSIRAKKITRLTAPAIVHTDGTSRVQTITNKDNPVLHLALMILDRRGLPPIMMNSSFNIAGEPIVDSIYDATKTFLHSKANILYINGERYEK